ncbi:MAG: hypothetical protein K1X78_23730 [Verrucomicrobiaceae bacterium]|nr:hypothetical protein [Verrucomicrobiaceae bacterium]
MQSSLPTPAQLFRQFEQGRISSEQFRSMMTLHHRLLIEDIDDAARDPGLSWFDEVLNRRAARHLEKEYGEEIVRETLVALAEMPDFPPAHHIWNAGHKLVPLYCFLRTRRAPVFRVIKMEVLPQMVGVVIEYGGAKKSQCTREEITLRRNRQGQLVFVNRVASR